MTFDKPAFKGDDYDFAMGSVKGMRSWEIDSKGRLRGITHPAIWLPGENSATCRIKPRCPKAPERNPWSLYEPESRPAALIKPCGVTGCNGTDHPSSHAFDPNCECGFWAYDEGDYAPHGQVTGIIEGYGRTTIGTKGFRCEKARVVALARENDENTLSLSKWIRLRELYPDADFYDDIDEMVLGHGAVLKTWPAVGEDFWAEDVEPNADTFSSYRAQLSALTAQMQTYRPSSFWSRGGVV